MMMINGYFHSLHEILDDDGGDVGDVGDEYDALMEEVLESWPLLLPRHIFDSYEWY